jgi:hypothetical protein
VRRLDDDAAVVVPGGETAEGPFFSPDGRWLAFAVGTSITGIHPPELRKYSLDTKLTQTIATLEDYFGGYWTEQGAIVFVGVQPRGLYTVPSGGGTPMPLVGQVRIKGKDQMRPLAWPDPLPGGSAVVITDWGTSTFGTLAVLDLETRELSSLGLAGTGAKFVAGGYIVYGSRDASLMAVPFDAATRRTTGTPVALMPDIAYGRNNVSRRRVLADRHVRVCEGLSAMEPSGAVADDTRDPIGRNNRVAVRVATLPARVCTVAWRRCDHRRHMGRLAMAVRSRAPHPYEAARRRDGRGVSDGVESRRAPSRAVRSR